MNKENYRKFKNRINKNNRVILNCYCKLCKKNKNLKDSHIISKFIYKWLKKTSPTGKFRNSENPNIRRQDGEIIPFLCEECEQKFSKFERYFQLNLFSKATQGKFNSFIATSEIRKFSVSLLWRCLKRQLYDYKDLLLEEIILMEEFLEDSELYLNSNNDSAIEKYSFHIIPTHTGMEERNMIMNDTIINQRGTDCGFRAFSKKNKKEKHDYLVFYVKIPFFLFIAEIKKHKNYVWKDTELILKNQVCRIDKIKFPDIVKEIMETMKKNKDNSYDKISPDQKAKIEGIGNQMNPDMLRNYYEGVINEI